MGSAQPIPPPLQNQETPAQAGFFVDGKGAKPKLVRLWNQQKIRERNERRFLILTRPFFGISAANPSSKMLLTEPNAWLVPSPC